MKMRIPLSAKLIVVVVAFLVVATVFFAQQSSKLFESVLVQREEYSNMTQATSKGNEIERLLSGAFDRAQLTGSMMVKQFSIDKKTDSPEIQNNFNKDKSLVALDIYKVNGDKVEFIGRQVKKEVLEKAQLTPEFITQLREQQKFPYENIIQKKIEVHNAIFPRGIPLITMGIPLVRDENDRVIYIAMADLDFGYLQKPFSEDSERVSFIYDKDGVLLAHQDDRKALARHSLKGHPLVDKSKDDRVPRRQIQFLDPETDEPMIGAYVQIPSFGLTVVSQTPKAIILEPAHEVRREAFYIAGIMISIAILFLFLFSSSLTGPIEILADLVHYVSRGNFDIKAKDKIKFMFPDEVHDLANAFDSMTDGLKERDKVKNLFSKFHGSSVTEDLLQKDIGVGGQRKEVTVFFSDIRGFTSFSESRTPEEVVEMLNEYFEVMVGIITKHKGVVDKFIGDAIMAVWGAPHSSDRDCQNALHACLEMRQSLLALNQKRESRGQPPLMIGIGLHTGFVISGTIGSTERMEYTVIGDTVNMTSRIESSTKAFGADLLVSDAVVQKVGAEFISELAGKAEVKGKSEPLSMFKVRGYVDQQTGERVEITTPYSDYEKGDADKVKVAS